MHLSAELQPQGMSCTSNDRQSQNVVYLDLLRYAWGALVINQFQHQQSSGKPGLTALHGGCNHNMSCCLCAVLPFPSACLRSGFCRSVSTEESEFCVQFED